MARTSTYLNFMGKTEAAFLVYRSIFKTDFIGPIMRMSDVPADPSRPPLPAADKNLVMHIELPILAGHVLMGTDTLESMGHKLVSPRSRAPLFVSSEVRRGDDSSSASFCRIPTIGGSV